MGCAGAWAQRAHAHTLACADTCMHHTLTHVSASWAHVPPTEAHGRTHEHVLTHTWIHTHHTAPLLSRRMEASNTLFIETTKLAEINKINANAKFCLFLSTPPLLTLCLFPSLFVVLLREDRPLPPLTMALKAALECDSQLSDQNGSTHSAFSGHSVVLWHLESGCLDLQANSDTYWLCDPGKVT